MFAALAHSGIIRSSPFIRLAQRKDDILLRMVSRYLELEITAEVCAIDSHQRRTFNRALKKALAGLGVVVVQKPAEGGKRVRVLSRSSIEAYLFFFVAAAYAVME